MKESLSILTAIKGKPSIALEHMVNGLLKQSKRKGFKVNMSTYGDSHGEMCYGCAATCAIQSIAKINFTPNTINTTKRRVEIAEADFGELNAFESAINQARQGSMRSLFYFCNIREESGNRFNANFDLQSNNWKKQLPQVRKTISELKKAGY